MKLLQQYQKDFKTSSDTTFRMLTQSEYKKVAKPILGFTNSLVHATSFNVIQHNYIQLLEKLSYLKGAIQDDLRIARHLHMTLNLLKSLYREAEVELKGIDTEDKSFIVIQAVKVEGGVKVEAHRTQEYQRVQGSVMLRSVGGDLGIIQHLGHDDWTICDIPSL